MPRPKPLVPVCLPALENAAKGFSRTCMNRGTIMPTPMRTSRTTPAHRMKSWGRWSAVSSVEPSSVNAVKLRTSPATTW